MHLGFQFNILVITGPNTGGKTVALKTVGLLAIMSQCGLHVPARQGSQLPIVDDVLADIGDEQSLEQSLSTFSSHVRRITAIFAQGDRAVAGDARRARRRHRPGRGRALGRAMLDELDSVGCRAIVTTHIGDLKTYAFTNPRAENAAVEFDLETLRPLYRVHIGDVGASTRFRSPAASPCPATSSTGPPVTWNCRQTGHDTPEWEDVQRLRHEAEQARQQALSEKSEAERTREA